MTVKKYLSPKSFKLIVAACVISVCYWIFGAIDLLAFKGGLIHNVPFYTTENNIVFGVLNALLTAFPSVF